jgi:hypothetical protein
MATMSAREAAQKLSTGPVVPAQVDPGRPGAVRHVLYRKARPTLADGQERRNP